MGDGATVSTGIGVPTRTVDVGSIELVSTVASGTGIGVGVVDGATTNGGVVGAIVAVTAGVEVGRASGAFALVLDGAVGASSVGTVSLVARAVASGLSVGLDAFVLVAVGFANAPVSAHETIAIKLSTKTTVSQVCRRSRRMQDRIFMLLSVVSRCASGKRSRAAT